MFHKVVHLFQWSFKRGWACFFPAKWARVSLPKTPWSRHRERKQ